MPNPNYIAGRSFEYATMSQWKEKQYSCIRASGSHGEYDVIAYRVDRKPEFIQCKVVTTEAEASRLIKEFKKYTIPSSHYHQSIAVRIKGSKDILSVTV